jgi:hypothetical protein
MASGKNTKHLARFDCPGGGQVWVDGKTLYIGHMRQPTGTTIVDISDPRQPKMLARVDVPQGWHSHKVRVSNGIMIVNHERNGPEGDTAFGGGLGIYDVSKPSEPRQIGKWRTHGKGVHRYDFDGRYAYISPTAEGYVGNIAMILDLKNPERPEEVGRWWIPGQWKAGGEPYPWDDWTPPRCHHPMRMGDRLYVAIGITAITSRHLRHVEAAGDRWRQHIANLSPSDPHLPADTAAVEGPQCHGGGG